MRRPKLSLEAKQAIVEKALSRGGKSLIQVAFENNVGYSALTRWLQNMRKGKPIARRQEGCPPGKIDENLPLKHVLAAANLDEQNLSAYCREHGIYNFQLVQWRDELMNNNGVVTGEIQSSNELRALREEVRELKRELRHKDKALAETAALLVLKKKADLLWAEPEGD